MKRTFSSFSRAERGAAAVEFALVAPFLVLILCGIIDFGRYYNARIELTGAVREGARVLALGTGDPVQITRDAAPTLASADIAVASSSNPCTSGQPASVAVSYDFDFLALPLGSIDIETEGVMRCGG